MQGAPVRLYSQSWMVENTVDIDHKGNGSSSIASHSHHRIVLDTCSGGMGANNEVVGNS